MKSNAFWGRRNSDWNKQGSERSEENGRLLGHREHCERKVDSKRMVVVKKTKNVQLCAHVFDSMLLPGSTYGSEPGRYATG
ncbi:hypothetical protein KIN20_007223 [Parelaphostrongylus tenuis]|uniref:Uncharacterized protein n=1 Tax=Parelaphostrongylus tenuis TaxID=148309 RepID=A0AAD5MLV4_PARTN|nr:hypothetical protein KIN20_007223 [Parelaphostrongylus tenuis]